MTSGWPGGDRISARCGGVVDPAMMSSGNRQDGFGQTQNPA